MYMYNYLLRSSVMAWAVIRPPLTTETRVRPQVTPSEANVRQIGTETGLSPSTSLLSYQ
jgi:hypothetical protein